MSAYARIGREPLKLGAHGKIRVYPRKTGEDGKVVTWGAETLYRGTNGVIKKVSRTGATKKEALARLTEAVTPEGTQRRPIGYEQISKPRPPDPDRPHVLYRFFNSAGDLLYVGISARALDRIEQHRIEKTWWTEITSTTLEHHPSYESARLAEKIAIRSEAPRYNLAN